MPSLTLRNLLSWVISTIAAVIAFMYGYEFGSEVSGRLLGFIAGVNCAIFAMVMADSVFTRLVVSKSADLSRQ